MFMVLYLCVFYLLSSPYLRVCGDDCVRGTREQMLVMQVALVQLSRGEGIDLGNFYLYYFVLETFVNPDGWLNNIVVLIM